MLDLAAAPAALSADTRGVSLTEGGQQTLSLEAGAEHAGKLYWVLGSATGTSPGMELLGAKLPLVHDAYFDFTLKHPNSAALVHTLGMLDAPKGSDVAAIAVAPGLDPLLLGLVLHHAFVVLDGGSIDLVSNPVSLTLTP